VVVSLLGKRGVGCLGFEEIKLRTQRPECAGHRRKMFLGKLSKSCAGGRGLCPCWRETWEEGR